MSADYDPSCPPGGPPGEDPSLDPDLLAAAAALADGTWTPADGQGTASACGPELHIIDALSRAHRAASRRVRADGERAAESSASLGEAMSRTVPVTTRPDLSAARRWGPLFVLEQVGSGSFGEVYRAWDPALDREVALKWLRFTDSGPEASAVVREGQLLASVRHPNVISVYGAAHIDGEVGIWTEFVRGRTLEQIVREDGPMSAQEATVVAESVCAALGAVHQAGLLHRDVKAANVMRASGGRIVLLDFGTGAPALDGQSRPARLTGTPLYMAPEILAGERETIRSDVYSLGVLTFFLVTGTYPVYGKSLADVRAAHAAGHRVLISEVRADLPLSFVRTVERALAPDSRRRTESTLMLLDELQPVRGAGISPGSGVQRRALWWLGGSVGGLVTVVVLGFFSSVSYRMGIGEDVVNESPLQWMVWGLRGLVAPLVFAALLVVGAGVLRVLLGGVTALLAGAAFVRRLRRVVLKFEMHTLSLVSTTPGVQWLLVLQVVTLGVLLVYFRALLEAVFAFVLPSDPSVLLPLRPGNNDEHKLFRQSLALHALVFALGWARAAYIAHGQRRFDRRVVIVAGAAALVLTLGALTLPFRILYHNTGERVTFGSEICYLVETAGDRARLLCPLWPALRRSVNVDDPALQRSGEREEVFTPLDALHDMTTRVAGSEEGVRR